MPPQLDRDLDRWLAAGLLTPEAAEGIRQFEGRAATENGIRLRWPVLVALGAGALMLGAGITLLVAAHWDGMSPAAQFGLVLLLVALFHAAGAAAVDRFAALATTFHALGTAALGAGIFLAARIFNLQSDWPNGILLWAAGAAVAWYLRREWTQAAFLALLGPIWLVGQWLTATERYSFEQAAAPLAGMLLLSMAYLWAESPVTRTTTRRLLTAIGAAAFLPLGVAMALFGTERSSVLEDQAATWVDVGGWLLFLVVPLVLGWLLRRREAWPLLIAALWVRFGTMIPRHSELLPMIWGAVGSLGITAAGVTDRSRTRVNLGVIGFALTVVIFYFSSVMDKLGRSTSLMGFGVLFLVGGWLVERVRRRLVASVTSEAGPS
ncbi:MAG: DUF2157 domain-containing protein [Gemmatimonadota bacterium]